MEWKLNQSRMGGGGGGSMLNKEVLPQDIQDIRGMYFKQK